ncbi:hypothetical protein B566_EDAN015443 [Ephemera danica]|nr:hypothetical protein B566_EDAN015443 [Ephemera danica]
MTDAMSHYTKCCKIGGNAAVIEDMDELKCLKPRRNLSKEPRYIAMYYTARRKLCPEYACSKNEVVTYNKNGTVKVSMKEAGKKTTYFLISGYDIYLNRTFFTCPDFHIIPDDMWANKEPNNLGNMECFVAMAFGEKFGFMDFGITTPLRYACQFPLNKKPE